MLRKVSDQRVVISPSSAETYGLRSQRDEPMQALPAFG
jgi:hypothetical protein